jgi:antirestriction protein ArdC
MDNEKLLEAQKALETGVANLVASEGWQNYLKTQARFHTYSFANVMWLMSQGIARGINVTRFAGYQTWKALGRQVRKGEQSYKVLAPMGYKKTDERTGEEHFRLRGFKVVSTFEVSQTDGEALPEPCAKLVGDGEELREMFAKLAKFSTSKGLTVAKTEIASGANGFFSRMNREIQVDVRLSDLQALKTLIHETAHSILPNDVDSDARATKEVEAESTAFVVMHALGFDSAEYSLGYVAHWAKGDAKLIQDVAIRVQKCAKAILEDVFVVRQTAWEKVSKNADADEERAA